MIPTDIKQVAEHITLHNKAYSPLHHIGAFKTRRLGMGADFREFRLYTPGDDVRHISWNTTAKKRKTMVKLYDSENTMHLTICVDLSGSSWENQQSSSKIQKYQRLTALLSLIAYQNKIPFRLITFHQRILYDSQLALTESHALSQFEYFDQLTVPQQQGGSFGTLGQYLLNTVKKQTHIFVLSDFHLDSLDTYLKQLAFRYQLHLWYFETLLIVSHASQACLDCYDPETGEPLIVDPNSLHDILKKEEESHQQALKNRSHRYGFQFESFPHSSDSLQLAFQYFHPRVHTAARRRSS